MAKAAIFTTGLMADLSQSGLAMATMNNVAKKALYIACDEFFRDPQGFQLRFSPRAYSELGLSTRAPATIRRKMKVFGGRDLPNVSPLAKGSAHLRDLLKVRGTGYAINVTAKGSVASAKITLPGARKQNQYGYKWEKYGRELFTLSGAQQWQAKMIMMRAVEIFRKEIFEEFARKNQVVWSA
jgi:hypothetical protein